MSRVAVLVIVASLGASACGDDDPAGDDAGIDAGPEGPALVVPAVIPLPYVVAGAGASMLAVTVSNPGTDDVHGAGGGALAWTLAGDADFVVVEAPDSIAAGAEATLTIRWAGAATPRIAGATLSVTSELGVAVAEVWAVAGDPALGPATFEPVTGAGGVTIGDSAVLSMPTAPFPAPGGGWTDDRVHVFVPEGYRQRDAHDVVVHFHGHSTTIAATVPAHRYREQVFASGADVILAVPQGPVNAASGDFGKLDDPAGTAAFLDELLIMLYRAGTISRPVLGQVTLTSHSGGYAAVARNLGGDPTFLIGQVDLFDSLYGFQSTYLDYALTGALLRSNYTASGGTDSNNQALAASLEGMGAVVATEPTQHALRDISTVIYFTAASHGGATRDDGAYGEQLRWGARHSRRGPRVELRAATASRGVATVAWLAPADDDLTGWRVETSLDGVAWTVAAEVAATTALTSFPHAGGARVRVVPVVDGVAAADAQASDVYRLDETADILVVDGFDRTIDGSWGGLAHDFAAMVGSAAGAVHTVSNEAVTEDGFDLAGYQVVIWLLGDESTDDHTFTVDERAALDAYLAGGGGLVISGSEVGYDQGSTTAGDAWLAAVAGAVFASDDAGTSTVGGIGPLGAIASLGFGGATAPYPEEYPDTFTIAGGSGATTLLQYATGGAAAVGISGRAVLVGFPLELIDDSADRTAVVRALVDFVAP